VIARHFELTGSGRARTILAAWAEWLPRFRRVAPRAGATRVLPAFKLEWEAAPPRVVASRSRRIAARGGYARA
jgi:glutamate synthase domain-containing protein 3